MPSLGLFFSLSEQLFFPANLLSEGIYRSYNPPPDGIYNIRLAIVDAALIRGISAVLCFEVFNAAVIYLSGLKGSAEISFLFFFVKTPDRNDPSVTTRL